MNTQPATRVVSIFVVLILPILQVSGQQLTSQDYDTGVTLVNKGLELKKLWQRLEQDSQNERDIVKATKLRQDAEDAQRTSRETFLKAVDSFKLAVKADPTSSSAYYYWGWAFNELEKYSEAIAPLNKARQLEPKDSSINFELGWAYDRLGRFKEAERLFNIAVKLQPDYADAWFELGWINEKTRQYQKAVKAYRQVINLKPENALARYNLALIYLKLGHKSAALEQHVILKTLDPPLANTLSETMNRKSRRST